MCCIYFLSKRAAAPLLGDDVLRSMWSTPPIVPLQPTYRILPARPVKVKRASLLGARHNWSFGNTVPRARRSTESEKFVTSHPTTTCTFPFPFQTLFPHTFGSLALLADPRPHSQPRVPTRRFLERWDNIQRIWGWIH